MAFAKFSKAKEILLTTQNVCSITSAVDSNSMKAVKDCLAKKVAARKNKSYPIYLYLNTPGGSVYDGLRFIKFAKNIRNLHTITEFSASMGAAIMQGLPGKRYLVEDGIVMFHRARGSVQGQFEDGELESRLRLWKKIVRKMEIMQANRIGISLSEYKERRMNEWWLYGNEAVTSNVADEEVVVKCSHLLMSKKSKRTVRGFIGNYEVEESNCPLLD